MQQGGSCRGLPCELSEMTSGLQSSESLTVLDIEDGIFTPMPGAWSGMAAKLGAGQAVFLHMASPHA